MKKICVYCASSNAVDESYLQSARDLGALLAKNNFEIKYGGGSTGLMGNLADAALSAGGTVTGIIPRFMHEVEWSHKKVSHLIQTETMGERKQLLLEGSDAVIALPGGTGTLEELFEAITLKKLGKYLGPIIIININGFYDGLITFLERCVSERFMDEKHLDMWSVLNSPDQIVEGLKEAKAWRSDAIDFAAIK